MPPTASRRSFTAAFKLKVIQYAEESSNMAAQREFNVSEKVIRGWRKQKDALKTTKKSKKAFRGNKPRWPELELQLEDWILEQRAACRGVNTVGIRFKAKEIASDLGITNFAGNPSWCFRFMRRKGLAIRRRTTLSQQLPADFQEKLDNFREFVTESLEEHSIGNDNVINMDEVPLTFDIPMNQTVESRGASTVNIRTTGHEKASFTVVLSCSATGSKLPPMVIFKRKTKVPEKCPPGVVVENNEKGWMDNDMFELWLKQCYVKRPGGFFRNKKSMLVLDSMRAHISEISKDRIRATNSVPAVIPGGLTKLLQPLDISVNRVFKNELRRIWEHWMCDCEHSFTKTGRMRRASYATVVQWVKDAWAAVPTSAINSGFLNAEICSVPEFMSDDEDQTVEDIDDLPLALAAIFHSDTEDDDFNGWDD